jgi:hypothetical protein
VALGSQVDVDALEGQAQQGKEKFDPVRVAGDGDTVQAYGLGWNGFGDGCAHGGLSFLRISGMESVCQVWILFEPLISINGQLRI